MTSASSRRATGRSRSGRARGARAVASCDRRQAALAAQRRALLVQRLAIGQDARDQLGVAVLLVARYLVVAEMDDEGVVVVVALAVAGEIPAARLQDDDVAAVDHARRDRRALGERAAERTKDLVDDRLLAGEFAAPRAAADRAPDDIVVARFPERGAVALGNLGEDVGHELSVARERGHCGSWTR